jgi:hypothetical protein
MARGRLVARCALLGTVMSFVLASAASDAVATVWQVGDVITDSQNVWGADPTPTNLAGVLQDNYNTVYASTGGVFELGIPGAAGFSILFTSASALLSYLPASGPPGALTSDLLNPTLTASGAFGGDVAALELNIDFSAAGLTPGTLGIPFGDLLLVNFDGTLAPLNGLTVRQYADIVITLLGGGAAILTIAELAPLTPELNRSFAGGTFVTQFAQDHLQAPGTVPWPGTIAFVGVGLMALGLLRRPRDHPGHGRRDR